MSAKSSGRIDLHIGVRIRSRRNVLGISQEALATRLGLTKQQLRKYEQGSNRVSASRLYELAQALGVSVHYFFLGLESVTEMVG